MQAHEAQVSPVAYPVLSPAPYRTVLRYAAVFLVMLSLSHAKLYGVRPFATAFFLALLYLDMPFAPTAALYTASEAAVGGTVFSLASAAIVCVIFGLFRVALARTKLPKSWAFAISGCLSALGIGAMLAFTPQMGLLHVPLYGALATMFAFCVRAALKPLLVEALRYQMLETEVIALAIFGMVAALGLAAVSPFEIPIVAFFAALAIFCTAKTAGIGRAVPLALVLGVGHAVAIYDVYPIAAYAFIALVGAGFCSAPRVVMPLAGLAGFAVFRFFFFTELTDAGLWLAAVAAGGLAYCAIPPRVFQAVKTRLYEAKTPAAVRYLINLNRNETAARLSGAASVFRSMSEILAKSEAAMPDYRGSLKNKCCVICEHYVDCAGREHERALDEMTALVFDKGRVHVADIPDFLTKRCTALAKLVTTASAMAEAHQSFLQRNACDARAKEIVAAQMRGMTDVLGELSRQSARGVSTDQKRERAFVEECNYRGLAAAEALITDEDVALVLRTETYERAAVEQAASSFFKQRYAVTRLDSTVLKGFCFVGLKPRPRYDMVFGVSQAPKKAGEKSGDTHAFVKIAPDRFMMALCDGMGSGAAAGTVSERAVGLVESFYRAGFSGELVLKSVNRFLSATGSESFSAIDICVVDLSCGTADVIKLGSPSTYIKRTATVERLDGTAAPLGVLDAVEPWCSTVSLHAGDMLVLASDGVTESFEGDRLSAMVNHTDSCNPQALAACILEHARQNSGGVYRDDSTVIAAKLIETV